MKVAKYIAEFLFQQGVRTVFMLSGTGSIHLDDAFAFHKGSKYICARHEAAAVMMAEANAKLSQNLGVVIATTGPGGTNAIGGLVEAWVDSAPVLVISGQVPRDLMVKNVRSFGVQGFNNRRFPLLNPQEYSKMHIGIEGKYALVTGGSRGIGLSIARALADEGCNIAICARGEERLSEAVSDLEKKGINAVGISVDVLNSRDIHMTVDCVVKTWGALHILINNVGGGGRWGQESIEDTPEDVWTDVYNKNAGAAIRFTRFAIP